MAAPAPVAAPEAVLKPAPAPLPPIPQGAGTGEDAQDFVRAHRIHVKDGSLFIDPYLVLHPRELAPDHADALRSKLQLTYSINSPSFFESPERTAIALNLGQLVPISLAAKRSQLLEQVRQFNAQVEGGGDAKLTAQATDKRNPFAAIVRDTTGNPQVDPAGLELLKNGLAVYLLVRQKLTEQGYYKRLTDYVGRMQTTDQVMGDLGPKIGVSPQQIREAALKGGLDGVGQLLGLDPRYVADVKEVSHYAATQDFGYNVVEHWHLGRQLLGPDATLQQRLAAGLEARISSKTQEYRGRVRNHYDVPAPVQAEEKRIGEALNLVEPIQRKLLYALGYEICFSPEVTADDIAFHRGIYGLHRKASNDLRDIRGTYRIYFSGKGELEGSMRTLVHEIAHNLWPDQFTAAQVQRIDALVNADATRFDHLNAILTDPAKFQQFERLLGAYHAGNPQEKAAVIATANELFARQDITVDALFPKLQNAYELRHLVAYAQDTLQVEGARYAKSGYNSPQERFREVISRYAELRQVRLRSEPELLNFIAPGLDQVWREHYIPHLEQVYTKVQQNTAQGAHAPVPAALAEEDATRPEPVRPGPAPEPKVQERPAAAAQASSSDLPENTVQKTGLEITPAIAGAEAALKQMGVRFAV